MDGVRMVVRGVLGLAIVGGGLVLVRAPDRAPWVVLASLALAVEPLARAWRAGRGTALRSSVVWGGVAVGLGMVAQGCAVVEPLATGRSLAGHWTYLATLATLAALISVLNARTPGGGAWAILMALLMLVFLIPWLEGPGLGRGAGGLGQLRLDSPWTIFYGLLVVAGVTNYLPTRYGPSAVLLGLGFGLEYAGLTRYVASPEGLGTIWSAVPWTMAAAVWAADLRALVGPRPATRLDAIWSWFRDHWGVVWALRVQERFNRSAEAQGWPFRLTWHGLAEIPGAEGVSPAQIEAAGATLVMLLRRFAEPGRIRQEGARCPAREDCEVP